MMNERLRNAFTQIHAEEALKADTKAYISQKALSYTDRKTWKPYVKYAVVYSVFLLMLLAGGKIYFTATVKISIDINPSFELSVNRFNQVVAVNGYNEDGKELASALKLRYQSYDAALNQIVENETIRQLLSDDEIMTITVTGSDKAQSKNILAQIETSAADKVNMYCYHANDKDVSKAHEAGLSFGKYRAYLELKKLVPNMSTDDIQGMTMREIHDLIHEHSNSDNSNTNHGHHGQGKGLGKGKHRRYNYDEKVNTDNE